MSFSKISAISCLVALTSKVAAHGTATGLVAEGVYYEGYYANFQYLQTQPAVVGWSIPEDQSNGFIAPDAYATSDIICHLAATNAQASATVAAGDTVEVQWTAWPSSHHGPVIDYLANCNGDCKTVDKTTLEFFKIDGVGLIDDTTVPGTWASDQLIANNNSWTVTIPSDIAAGNYVLRHEIIALHSAGTVDGAQNYPQCFNLEVTGGGTAAPAGTLGTALYTETDPGIEVNIYTSLSTYVVPGPTLYSGAVSISQTLPAAPTSIAPVGTEASGAVVATTSSASSQATSSSSIVSTSAASTFSASTSAVSTSAGVATTSSSTPVVSSPAQAQITTSPILSTSAPFGNSTKSSSTKKSACKNKSLSKSRGSALSSATSIPKVATKITTSSSASLLAAPTGTSVTIPTTSPGVVVTSIATATSESTATTTIAAAAAETTSASASASSGSSSSSTTMPEGTTLDTLLSWVAAAYEKLTGSSYSGSSVVARRHPRDVVRA